jgi:hypothetical protein
MSAASQAASRSCVFVAVVSKLIAVPSGVSTSAVACPYVRGMEELLRTTDPTVIAFARALLSGEDIECFEMDVHMSVLEGSIGVLPRRLLVRREDLFVARAVMTDNGIEVSRR